MSSRHETMHKKRKTPKIKTEPCENSQSKIISDEMEEKDLTHSIKDRVELMRQVFLILRDRELLAMAPDCLRSLRIDDIQELLLDEVLGISSKRLHSILDSYPCPSDTESSDNSSSEHMETISLDSISSEEDIILSHQEHKLKKKNSKKHPPNEKLSKKKSKLIRDNVKLKRIKKGVVSQNESNNQNKDDNTTGMTVLELLELQARARAIRAQLAAVEVKDISNEDCDIRSPSSDCDEVVIKEEPPDVVEIASSSDDNEESQDTFSNGTKIKHICIAAVNASKSDCNFKSTNVTSEISDVDKNITKPLNRKIILNRNNLHVAPGCNSSKIVTSDSPVKECNAPTVPNNGCNDKQNPIAKNINDNQSTSLFVNQVYSSTADVIDESISPIEKTNLKNYLLDSDLKKGCSDDDDEITLELSDSEKMDLLEELHSPRFNKNDVGNEYLSKDVNSLSVKIVQNDLCVEVKNKNKKPHRKTVEYENQDNVDNNSDKIDDADVNSINLTNYNTSHSKNKTPASPSNIESSELKLSDGECSFSSDGIEITETKAEILSVSEDGDDKIDRKTRKYRKRKRNENESPTRSDKGDEDKLSDKVPSLFSNNIISQSDDVKSEVLQLNVSKANVLSEGDNSGLKTIIQNENSIDGSDYIFEISDDSDDDTLSAFSKEPTREEIEELSRKIDTEIEREGFDILGANTVDLKIQNDSAEDPSVEAGVSWKSRWLNSDRVKKVLATSNLCNALRKKNKELKTKLEKGPDKLPSNEIPNEPMDLIESQKSPNLLTAPLMQPDEGTVSQYEMLSGSSKYAQPVIEQSTLDEKSMIVDAKQLLKMYKCLLKMHNLGDPNKSIKDKKMKKDKKKHKKDKKDKKKGKSPQTANTN